MKDLKRKRGFSLTELMIVVAIISILAIIGTVNYSRARARSMYTGCVANVKNLATALVMYSKDHDGRYPTTLNLVTPNFMKTIPTCPSAAFATYIAGYARATNPDAYTVVCSGSNHAGAGKASNFPQYTAVQGLVEQ